MAGPSLGIRGWKAERARAIVKVLRVADVPGTPTGGMAGVMLHGGAALAQLGHHVDYMFREDLGDSPGPSQARRLVAPFLVVRAVRRRLRDGCAYDIVEIHEPLAAAYCAIREVSRLPACVVLSHGLEARGWQAQRQRWVTLGRRPSLKSRVAVPSTLLSQARFALQHADQVIVLTTDDEDYLVDRLRVPKARISRVDNGVSPFPIPERDSGGPQIPRRSEELRLLFFGSWIDRKGSPDLVRAVAALEAQGVRFTITVAGCGRPVEEVASAFPPEVRHRVTIYPSVARSEVTSLLADHDVLIAASWFEGMPLTVLEAAAAGLALILTDISGHRQILDAASDGRRECSALLVPPHYPQGIVRAVIQLMDDPGLRSELQTNARRLAEVLTWEHAAKQLEEAYLRASTALSDRRSAGRGRWRHLN